MRVLLRRARRRGFDARGLLDNSEQLALGIDPIRMGIDVDLADGSISSRFLMAVSVQFL